MQSLPPELKHLIVKLSSESPNSLVALARTHSAYQSEAEKALYNTLSIFANSDDSVKCMETLAANSEKAALVRFLIIEYDNENLRKNRRITACLSKSLINMRSLSDFRVRACPLEIRAFGERMIKGLGKNLWSVCKNLKHLKTNDFAGRYSDGHFRLQTFYCYDVLNISRIIKSQPNLQILGLYCGSPKKVVKTLKNLKLHNAELYLPIVLILERVYYIPSSPDHISIFPAFYSVDRRATIPQVLVQSFSKDQGNFMVARAEGVRKLSIYLNDSSEMPSISALAKDMAVNFPQIDWLNLIFERRCEIVSF